MVASRMGIYDNRINGMIAGFRNGATSDVSARAVTEHTDPLISSGRYPSVTVLPV
jgi:hypothetical protein